MRTLCICLVLFTLLAAVCQAQAATWKIPYEPTKDKNGDWIVAFVNTTDAMDILEASGSSNDKGESEDVVCLKRYFGVEKLTGCKIMAKDGMELEDTLGSITLSYTDAANSILDNMVATLSDITCITESAPPSLDWKFFRSKSGGLDEIFCARLMGKYAAANKGSYLKRQPRHKDDPKPSQRFLLTKKGQKPQEILIISGPRPVLRLQP